VRAERLAKGVRLVPDALDQLFEFARVVLRAIQLVAKTLHPVESRADVVRLRCRRHAELSDTFAQLSPATNAELGGDVAAAPISLGELVILELLAQRALLELAG
jgi:hypothetical protein